jgi:ketosteroid isomerase-like protein
MTSENEQLITKFYQAAQQKDYAGMQSCYADNATFSDEVFKNLNATEVKSMWEMLLKNGKDLQIVFKNITTNETTGSAEWEATYTFSLTNRKVINCIQAKFVLKNGKIVQHIDHFNFYRWAQQAFGFSGYLLGWTSFLKNKVRQRAAKNLSDFMRKNNL